MISRVGLLNHLARRSITARQPTRKLYTDHIYPYPFNYFNNEVFPSRHCYRETHPTAPWRPLHDTIGMWAMRIFWTYFFFKLFSDPGTILGHLHVPDPATWTDAELGIPPDEAGPYKEWLRQQLEKELD